MEGIAAVGALEETHIDELFQHQPADAGRQTAQGGCGTAVEVRPGVAGAVPEDLLLLIAECLVRHGEGRTDTVVVGVQMLQRTVRLPHGVQEKVGRGAAQPGGDGAQGEGEAAQQLGDLGEFGFVPGEPADVLHQRHRVGDLQRSECVAADVLRRHRVGERGTAGDQDQRIARGHVGAVELGGVRDVVEQYEGWVGCRRLLRAGGSR